MTPDLLARLALRRSLAADDGLAETEARSTEGGSSSGAESEAGDDRKFDAALDTYEEAPPSELNSFVSRLMGLEAVEVQDDGLGEDEAYEWRSAQESFGWEAMLVARGRCKGENDVGCIVGLKDITHILIPLIRSASLLHHCRTSPEAQC